MNLQPVEITSPPFDAYKQFIPEEQYEGCKKVSKKFKGLRVAHINATAQGGGVAEILQSLVGLMNGVGLYADWYIMPQPENPIFFEITKSFHNALQGKKGRFLTENNRKIYIDHNIATAKLMDEVKPDIWIVHDPQPLASINYLKDKKSRKIVRIHIDTSHPNKEAWDFIGPILKKYDRAIFTMPEFVSPDIPKEKVKIFYPAIDPLAEKNRKLSIQAAELILERMGINITKPLMVQVARFDPWKDPLGVIDAYYKAKNDIPDLQLAFLGLMIATDDPEAIRIFEKVKRYAKGDPDIFLFADVSEIKSLSVSTFVNAFQTAADVVLQKSIREGFGLVVTEAMWKGKPVIGGNVGGIKHQIVDGKSGFLVNSSDEAAERIVYLFNNPKLGNKMGIAARKRVRENFLMPRLLLDYLKLFEELI